MVCRAGGWVTARGRKHSSFAGLRSWWHIVDFNLLYMLLNLLLCACQSRPYHILPLFFIQSNFTFFKRLVARGLSWYGFSVGRCILLRSRLSLNWSLRWLGLFKLSLVRICGLSRSNRGTSWNLRLRLNPCLLPTLGLVSSRSSSSYRLRLSGSLLSCIRGRRLGSLCRLRHHLLLWLLLLEQVLLLLLVGKVLLGVLTLGGLLLWVDVIFNISEVFQHVDQHGSLLFHVCLVRVPNEVHVNFAVGLVLGASLFRSALLGCVFVVRWIEGFFLVEVVKVLVRNFTCDAGLVGRNLVTHPFPIKIAEKRVRFNFVCSIFS